MSVAWWRFHFCRTFLLHVTLCFFSPFVLFWYGIVSVHNNLGLPWLLTCVCHLSLQCECELLYVRVCVWTSDGAQYSPPFTPQFPMDAPGSLPWIHKLITLFLALKGASGYNFLLAPRNFNTFCAKLKPHVSAASFKLGLKHC